MTTPTAARSHLASVPDGLARPVLVGGCPRSGTTLLGAMLGVGSRVLTVPESDFKWSMLRRAQVQPGVLDRSLVVEHLRSDRRFRRWDVDTDVLATTGTAPYAHVMDEVVRAHGQRVGKSSPRAWVDHTPWNLKYAATLAELMPDARFVHVVRDGRAVAASLRRLDWGPTSIDQAATWWASHVAMGLAAERMLEPGRVVLVRYEDLVRYPEATLAELRERLGLVRVGGAAHRRDFQVDEYTARQHALVAAPPDARRVDAWQGVLSPRQIETFERRTGDLLTLLGYEARHGAEARSPSTLAHGWDAVAGLMRRHLLDRPRRRRRERRSLTTPDGAR